MLERKQREEILCYADDAHVQDSVKTIKSLMAINQFGCYSKLYETAIPSATATATEYGDGDDEKMCRTTGENTSYRA